MGIEHFTSLPKKNMRNSLVFTESEDEILLKIQAGDTKLRNAFIKSKE